MLRAIRRNPSAVVADSLPRSWCRAPIDGGVLGTDASSPTIEVTSAAGCRVELAILILPLVPELPDRRFDAIDVGSDCSPFGEAMLAISGVDDQGPAQQRGGLSCLAGDIDEDVRGLDQDGSEAGT